MKVRFHQSGGFTGLLKGCVIDTSALVPEQAKEVEQLVRASSIPRSGEFLSNSARDLFQYEIIIDDGVSKRCVIYDDQSLPASAKPLVRYLKKLAKPEALK